MAKLNGTQMLVILDGVAIGGTKSFTLDINRSNINSSSKDSGGVTERIYGAEDWSVSFDGLYDPANTQNFEQLFDLLVAKTKVYLEMAVIDGAGGGELYKGNAVIGSVSLTAPMEDVTTMSGTFEADGAITKGTVVSS